MRPAQPVQAAPRGAPLGALRPGRPHRGRDRARAARAGLGHIAWKVNSIVDEQLIDALYRASQAGVPVRALGARHLRAAPGRAGAVREHRGALDPRPLPRALADLPVRRRGRPAGLHRQRRHDAPQPRPPRRGAGAARRPAPPRRPRGADRARHERRLRRTGGSAATAAGCATTSTTTASPSPDLQAALIEMHAKRRRKARRR